MDLPGRLFPPFFPPLPAALPPGALPPGALPPGALPFGNTFRINFPPRGLKSRASFNDLIEKSQNVARIDQYSYFASFNFCLLLGVPPNPYFLSYQQNPPSQNIYY